MSNKPTTDRKPSRARPTRATAPAEPALRLTSLESLGQAAECLRALAHPHRLRMIQMLLQAEFPVAALARACEIPPAMASEHLRLMQRCGFLAAERRSRQVFYRVSEPHLASILACIEHRFGGQAA
jgi:DNA-binding transcriptional ArsR family regulator